MRKIFMVLSLFIILIAGCKKEDIINEDKLNVKFFNSSNFYTILLDENNNSTVNIEIHKYFVSTKEINPDDVTANMNSDNLIINEFFIVNIDLDPEDQAISSYKGHYYYQLVYIFELNISENVDSIKELSLSNIETNIKIEENNYKQTFNDFEVILLPKTIWLQQNALDNLVYIGGPVGKNLEYGNDLIALTEKFIYDGRKEDLIITGGGILNEHLKMNKLYINGVEFNDAYQPEYKEELNFSMLFKFDEKDISLNNFGFVSYYIDYMIDGISYRSYETSRMYYHFNDIWVIDQWIESGVGYDEFY